VSRDVRWKRLACQVGRSEPMSLPQSSDSSSCTSRFNIGVFETHVRTHTQTHMHIKTHQPACPQQPSFLSLQTTPRGLRAKGKRHCRNVVDVIGAMIMYITTHQLLKPSSDLPPKQLPHHFPFACPARTSHATHKRSNVTDYTTTRHTSLPISPPTCCPPATLTATTDTASAS